MEQKKDVKQKKDKDWLEIILDIVTLGIAVLIIGIIEIFKAAKDKVEHLSNNTYRFTCEEDRFAKNLNNFLQNHPELSYMSSHKDKNSNSSYIVHFTYK